MTDMAAQAEAHYAQQRVTATARLEHFLAWFRIQLDLDEGQAEAAGGDQWQTGTYQGDQRRVRNSAGRVVVCDSDTPTAPTHAQAMHIATWSPNRALWEIDGKRTIIGYVMDDFADDDQYGHERVMGILLPLAYVYHDRPGWDDMWTR